MKAKTSRQNKGLFTSRTINIITLVSTSVRAAVMKNIHKKNILRVIPMMLFFGVVIIIVLDIFS